MSHFDERLAELRGTAERVRQRSPRPHRFVPAREMAPRWVANMANILCDGLEDALRHAEAREDGKAWESLEKMRTFLEHSLMAREK